MNKKYFVRVCLPIQLLLLLLAVGLFYNSDIEKRRERKLEQISSPLYVESNTADELSPEKDKIQIPQIEQETTAIRIQAETVEAPEGTRRLTYRKGYLGIGYLSFLPDHTESAFSVEINIPASQHYAVTICAASGRRVTNALRINGKLFSQFTLEGEGDFMRITFYGIFMEKGKATIALDTIDNGLDLDYIDINQDTSVYETNFNISEEPCTPNSSENTRKLYSFLREHWGKQMLTGQYVSDKRNLELSLIYRITGQLPVIRFGELGAEQDLEQIEAATDWAVRMHGLVGFMWQWKAPGSDSVYSKETNFNLEKTLRACDVKKTAGMSIEEAETAVKNGTCSDGIPLLLTDIDNIAASLRKLADMDIPVLWRPLHEAGGGWYWWGGYGQDAYVQLWELLYYRLTQYHGLNNLIWIWNGQSSSYLVPNHTYDIASVDVYLQPDMIYGSRYEQYLSLARITAGKKLLALSECSSIPSPEMILLDHSVWSFFGLWYGEYLMNPDGSFSDYYYSSNDLYNLYNCDLSLTLNDFLEYSQKSLEK